MTPHPVKRAGFAAIIGAPNAGKSTLVNALVGEKISIVTHKVQTTRFSIRGICQHGDAQIILIDTPGIFSAKRRLDRSMVKAAWSGSADADARIHLIDAAPWVAREAGERLTPAQKHSLEDDERIIESLKLQKRAAFLALNKVDLFSHRLILPLIEKFSALDVYEEIFVISSLNGEGLDPLRQAMADKMPASQALYDKDQTADIPLMVMAAEITREKLMLRLHQELPYKLMVETENWETLKNGSIRIDQAVILERASHKAMVLGKGGQTIKAVSQAAREDLCARLGRKVHLFLFVKVDEKWPERRERYTDFGLEFDV